MKRHKNSCIKKFASWLICAALIAGSLPGVAAFARMGDDFFPEGSADEEIVTADSMNHTVESSSDTVKKADAGHYIAETFSNAIRPLDADPDGVWAVGDVDVEGEFTTYETFDAALKAASAGDTITLLADTTENITITEGSEVTLDLNGYTLSGDGSESVVTIKSGADLTLEDGSNGSGCITGGAASEGAGVYNAGIFTMNGGSISNNTASQRGGGVYNDGNDSIFTMTDGEITENTATRYGGGIYNNSGTLSITEGTISENTASSTSYGWGGGIYNNSGTLSITEGTISGNTAVRYGGGIYTDKGTVTMAGGSISENKVTSTSTSYGYGGGVYITGSSSTFIMEGGTINGNSATNIGGGIYAATNGKFTMESGVISENTAVINGGGVYNSGTFNMTGGTINNNTTTSTSSSYGYGGGVYNNGTFNMTKGSLYENESRMGSDVYTKDGKNIALTPAGKMSDDSGKDFTYYVWIDELSDASDPEEYTGTAITDEPVSTGELALTAVEKGSLTYNVDDEEWETDSYMPGVVVTIKSGEDFNISDPHFVGWSTAEGSTDAEYVPGDTYILKAGNTVLYAAYSDHDWIETEEVETEENMMIVHVTFTCSYCEEIRQETVIIETKGEGIEAEDDLTWDDLIDDSELDDYFFEDDEKIEVEVTVTDGNGSVSESDKKTAEETIEELWPDEEHSDFYFDIEIEVDIYDSDGELEKTVIIEESVNPGTFTVMVPDDLLKAPGDTYTVIVIHDGEAVALETIDNGNGTLTFTTDKFDGYTYVIVKTTGTDNPYTRHRSSSDSDDDEPSSAGRDENTVDYVKGSWTEDEYGYWRFTSDTGKRYENEWGYICNPYADISAGQAEADWFHFGDDGIMDTGWFYENGNTYYLHTAHDGTRGYMYTGWHMIDGIWYYFSEDEKSLGILLKDTTTPDGYRVDAEGRYTE